MRVQISKVVIKIAKNDSLDWSRFIVIYFFILLFITSCTNSHKLSNSSSLQINTSNAATGTGFLFGSQDYIITNYHVVKGTSAVKVKFTNEEMIDATAVFR